jgi:D-alanyl-D-alanine carboxypeptidase
MKNLLKTLFCLFVFAIAVKAQNFDPTLAAALQNRIDSIRIAQNLKGISAAVIYPGMGKWQGTSGISHNGTAISSDMEFGIASNTKLFTAVLMLKLAENNIISLEDSLHEYLPTYNNIDPNITIRQLLNQTTGLDDVSHVPGYADSMMTNPNRVFTASELLSWAGPPIFAAGTDWNYCNTNYLLAAMIAESATGRTYGQLLRDSILTPLNLDSTFLDVYDTVLYRIAHPWQNGFDNFNIPRTSVNSAAWSAGAMYSTSGEMTDWYDALMNGQVLNQTSFNEMTTFVGSGNYGMGIAETNINNRTVWYHGGQIWGGYNSSMMYDTASGIIICVLVNQIPAQAYLISSQLHNILTSNPISATESYQENAFLKVYPNPAKDRIFIEVPNQEIKRVAIFDLNSRLIKNSETNNISISELPDAVYIIKVKTNKGIYHSKFIKGE